MRDASVFRFAVVHIWRMERQLPIILGILDSYHLDIFKKLNFDLQQNRAI
jgi:hypothetical protein